jgi:hypothetical protein
MSKAHGRRNRTKHLKAFYKKTKSRDIQRKKEKTPQKASFFNAAFCFLTFFDLY